MLESQFLVGLACIGRALIVRTWVRASMLMRNLYCLLSLGLRDGYSVLLLFTQWSYVSSKLLRAYPEALHPYTYYMAAAYSQKVVRGADCNRICAKGRIV